MSLCAHMRRHTSSHPFLFDPVPGSQEEEKTRNSFSYLHQKAHQRLAGRPMLFKEIIKYGGRSKVLNVKVLGSQCLSHFPGWCPRIMALGEVATCRPC